MTNANGAAKGLPQKRTRRGCCVVLLVMVLITILALGGIFAWFYGKPVQNESLNARVKARLERISGLDVQYDSARLTVATGLYEIANLRFYEKGKSEQPLLTVGEVLARVRPWDVVVNPEAVIKEVVLKNPSALDVEYSEASVRPGKRLQFLLNSIKEAQPPGVKRTGRLPFDDFRIENLQLAFSEKEGILPDLVPGPPVMFLSGNATANEGKEGLEIEFAGTAGRPGEDASTSETMASDVKVKLAFGSDDLLSINGEAKDVSFTRIFRELPATRMAAENLKLQLETKPLENGRLVKGVVDASVLKYTSPEKAITISDQNVQVNADLDINTSSGLLLSRNMDLRSDGAHLMVTGDLDYKGADRRYNLNIKADKVAEYYRNLLSGFLPAGWIVTANDNSISVNMEIAGNDKAVSNLVGTMAVRDVHLLTPGSPEPFKNLQGDLEFQQKNVTFKDVTADYAGTRMALDGKYMGSLFDSSAGEVNLNWSAVVPLEDVIRLHGSRFSTDNKMHGQGTITGRGTYVQIVDLRTSEGTGMPKVDGSFEFKGVGLSHDSLPAPIAGLDGQMIIKDNRLVVDHLDGTMQGNELKVTGEMVGNKVFWNDAKISASLHSHLSLSKLGPYLTDRQKEMLEKYELSGDAETDVVLDGPVKDLATKFTGKVRLKNVSFQPHLDFMTGGVKDLNGVVTWNGEELELDDVVAGINGESVKLNGSLSAGNVRLQIDANPNLAVLEKTFPKLDKYLEMSGKLATQLELKAEGKSDIAPSSTIGVILDSALKTLQTAVSENSYELNGDVQFQGATIRHIGMPAGRKENGRDIPRGVLSNMDGKATVNKGVFRASESAPITCSFADTPGCRLSGVLELRKDNFPSIKMKVVTSNQLKLDTWALGWGKDFPHTDKPLMTGKKFDLDAEVIAPSVIFRGQKAGRSRAKFSFKLVQNDSPRVTNFEEVVVQGSEAGSGRVIGTGRIESFLWSPNQYPKWQTSLDVQNMRLESMLQTVFLEPMNIHGNVSGNLSVQGTATDSRSIRGQGSAFMSNLELGRTAVIRQLGQTTGRNLGGTSFETAQAATFEIGNGALSSRDLNLQTNGLQMEMRGDYWFAGDPARGITAKTIDGSLRLRLFKTFLGSVPIVSQLADLADEVTNSFLLAFRVTGTADNPRISPIALPMFQGGT